MRRPALANLKVRKSPIDRKQVDRAIATVLVGTVPVNRLAMPLARRFNQICLAATAALLRPDDLAPLHYAVLAYLNHQPGIDQRGLAACLAIDRTNAGLLLDQLEERKLVERHMDPGDRRVRLLRLTTAGKRLFDRYAPRMRALDRNITETALGPAGAERFLDMLVHVIQANESLARPGLGRRKRKPALSAENEKQSHQI